MKGSILMKNVNKIIVVFLLVLSMLFISTDVYAGDYSLKELIPVSDEANVYSKTFNYTGVKFETSSDGKVNGDLLVFLIILVLENLLVLIFYYLMVLKRI